MARNADTPDVGGEAPDEFLQGLLLETTDVEEYLAEFAAFAADHLSRNGAEVQCGVTVLRERKAGTVASSSDRARSLDEIQYEHAQGPCLTACREQRTVRVADVRAEQRWPTYMEAIGSEGIRSVLGVPFLLGHGADAALNIYSTEPHMFDDAAVERAETFVRRTSRALELALHFARKSDAEAHLRAAMESRTTIDVAVGIIMAQNRCSQDEAFRILQAASNARNIKLREVAAAVTESVGQGPATTHFAD